MYKILFIFWCSTLAYVTIKREPAQICTTESCMKTSAQIRNYMDESLNPCEDFYEYACGKFIRKTPIPQDRSSLTSFSLVQDQIDQQLRVILTEEPQLNETKAVKLAKILMKTCLDDATLNQKGITPLVEIIEKFGGWPIVKGDNWNSDDWDWLEVTKKLSRDGSGSFILASFVSVDFKNTSKRIMSISRASFGLSQKFLLKGMEHAFVKAYYDYMVDAAVIFGANKINAETESLNVLQFEMELAKVSLPEEESRNKSLTYNPFTIKELQTTFPFINWLEFINWELHDSVHVDENEVIIVIELNYLSKLHAILNSTPKRTIANYYAWLLFLSYSEYLNDVLHERHEKFLMAMTGKPKSLPRLIECVKLTVGYLSISVGASYVQKYFNEQTKQVAAVLTKTIHEEFIETLQNVPWLDEKSRAAAIVKVHNMHFNVAFPQELVDNEKLENYYRGLELQPDSLLQNIMQIHKFFHRRSINKLRLPVNKTDWETHSITTSVNAFYSFAENSIQLPAAVLQNPFFSAERPAYLNFAAIGWIIGHEITHGFDDEGRQFDSDGNVLNLWQEDTIEKFTKKAQCFIKQYANFTHPTLNLTVNGVITQGENIADNGGIKVAYEAYQRFTQRNGPESELPDLSLTPNQLFWISAAQIWCSVTRPESDTMHYTTNSHAPDRFRIIGTFQNSPHFANDFNCASGTTMNPIKSQKCEIW